MSEKTFVLLIADKEGGFAVFSKGSFKQKASEAAGTVFKESGSACHAKGKIRVKKLCKRHPHPLLSAIDDCQKMSLDMFFTPKSHKVDVPLRVNISENGAWQKCLGKFLHKSLALLAIDDRFQVKKLDDIIEYLKTNHDKQLRAFSFDVKDLYYSIPHDTLLKCISEVVDGCGAVAFQNAAGISVGNFLDFLITYLESTYAEWNGRVFIQKKGICIAASIAPLLSDFYLAMLDRALEECLLGSNVATVFRFADNSLVILDCDPADFAAEVTTVCSLFSDVLAQLELIHEVPLN